MVPLRLVALLLSLSTPAMAQSPIAGMPIAGPKSKVLNIGSVHLSEFSEWTPAMLEPLLTRLAAFQPAVITQEGVSGEQCAQMRAFPDLYGESYDGYCWDPGELLGSTRLSVPEALRAVDETLRTWPQQPTAGQRRRLAMLFLASGDRVSAKVQWLRLQPTQRQAGDGFTPAMIQIIERKGKPMNESYDVAATLAARLGLERVYAVDDHTSDGALAHVGAGYEKALMAHWQSARTDPIFLAHERRTKEVNDPASLLALYRELNRKGGVDDDVRSDFGGAMAQPSAQLWGRQYLGWWEVRNLRMAANIRATFAGRPGVRVLNIVGSAHKPWYDMLMAQMADVEVVDAESALR